ncbi:unnamed protein product [Urochloa humidicola]
MGIGSELVDAQVHGDDASTTMNEADPDMASRSPLAKSSRAFAAAARGWRRRAQQGAGPDGELVDAEVGGGDGERGHDAAPDGDIHGERGARLRGHEREHEAGVRHQERVLDEPGPGGGPRQDPHGKEHGDAERHPAPGHEQPVAAPVLVPHYRVAGDVPVVVLPVPARDVGPQLVRQRRDQRRHHQQRVPAVIREVRRVPAAAASVVLVIVAAVLLRLV